MIVDIKRSSGEEERAEDVRMMGKILIYCFIVNYDKKITYTQGDNFQMLGLLKSVKTIFKKKEEHIFVTAYLYYEIYKKMIQKIISLGKGGEVSISSTFLRWCILTFGLSKNKKILKK